MKKILMVCGVAAMMLGISSCNGGSSNADKGFSDSLATAVGQFQGYRLASEYQSVPEAQKANLPKAEILRGIKQIIMTDTTQQAYISGLSIGMQLYSQLYRYEQAGIPVDRAKLYEAYAAAFNSDSIAPDVMASAQEAFRKVSEQAQQKMMQKYEEERAAAEKAKEESPEAKENVKKGTDFVKELKAKDPEIKTTASGLSYKVVKEGEGEPVGKTGRAQVAYKGTLIDGTVFDENDNATFSPNQVIAGFGEGLGMMNKGAKYIFYIPGNLAYGANGTPDGKIGPMATLVFEVEAKDVTPGK